MIARTTAVREPLCACLAVMTLAGFSCSSDIAGQGRAATEQSSRSDVIDDLVAANRILANEGIVDGLGHVSVRHPQRADRFLISRDLAPALVTAADLVEYDLDGNPVSSNAPRGYGERFIHAAIYKARPDMNSVVHAHTLSVVPFTVSNVALRPVFHVAAFLLPGVPIFEIRKVSGHVGMLVNDVRSGTVLAQTLGDKAVVLMRGHGFAAGGPTIIEAVHRSIILDVNARMQTQAMGLGGTITYLSPADVAGAPPPQSEATRGWPALKERALRR